MVKKNNSQITLSPRGVESHRKTTFKRELGVIETKLSKTFCKEPNKSVDFLLDDWMTHSSQQQLACYINNQLYSLPVTKEKIHVGIPLLTTIFKPFTQLSKPGDSENGVTAMLGIENSTPFAIMKYGVKPRILTDEDLIHELAVGLVLNEMRDICPYFMYTYGALYCNPPYTYERILGKQPFELGYFCNDKHVTTLYIAELCRDSMSLEEFFTKINQKKYYHTVLEDVMVQIAIALHLAYDKFKFCHNDLHIYNIRVRFLASPVTMIYKIDNKEIKIRTQIIPQIIDYGYSTLQVNGTKLFPEFINKIKEPGIYSYNVDMVRIFGIMYDDIPLKYLTPLLVNFGTFFDHEGEESKKRFTSKLLNQYSLINYGHVHAPTSKVYNYHNHVPIAYDSNKLKSLSHKLSKPKSHKIRCPNGFRRNKKTGECDKVKSPKYKSPKTSKRKSFKPKSHKIRCPNGFKRNKVTGECDKVKSPKHKSPKTSKPKSHKIRCPNGFRRNKVTGGCDKVKKSHKLSKKKNKLGSDINKFFDQFKYNPFK